MYKYLTILAYLLVFAAFFPVASNLLGTDDLFFKDIPYPYSLYYEYRWHLLVAGLILGVAGWFSARKRIDDVTDYKLYTRAHFSKRKKELLKKGKQAERKLKHLAMRTSWAPVFQPTVSKQGWQNMANNKTTTLKVKKNKNGRLYLVPRLVKSLFNIFIITIGVLLLTSSFWADGGSGSDFWVYLFGIAMVLGGILLFKLHTHFYFDKSNNTFVEIENTFLNLNLKKKIPSNKKILALDDIAALQIIREYQNNESDGWELNIIRKDAKRHNIMQSGRRVLLTESAVAISKYLDVPVWEDSGAHFGVVQENTVTVPTWDSIFDLLRKKT